MYKKVFHTIDPVYDSNSRILILGSIPSPKSREQKFYYAHPQNRFWRVLAHVFGISQSELLSTEQKRTFLLKNRIALWDVISECEISGASDSSIKNPIPNNLNRIIKSSDIRAVFTTGKKAFELYNKLCRADVLMDAVCLPSTSPANCAVTFEQLADEYKAILEYL